MHISTRFKVQFTMYKMSIPLMYVASKQQNVFVNMSVKPELSRAFVRRIVYVSIDRPALQLARPHALSM